MSLLRLPAPARPLIELKLHDSIIDTGDMAFAVLLGVDHARARSRHFNDPDYDMIQHNLCSGAVEVLQDVLNVIPAHFQWKRAAPRTLCIVV